MFVCWTAMADVRQLLAHDLNFSIHGKQQLINLREETFLKKRDGLLLHG